MWRSLALVSFIHSALIWSLSYAHHVCLSVCHNCEDHFHLYSLSTVHPYDFIIYTSYHSKLTTTHCKERYDIFCLNFQMPVIIMCVWPAALKLYFLMGFTYVYQLKFKTGSHHYCTSSSVPFNGIQVRAVPALVRTLFCKKEMQHYNTSLLFNSFHLP